MRRTLAVVAALSVLAAAAGGAVWLAKRTVRWNDARTMPPPLTAAVRAYAKGDAAAGLASVHELLRQRPSIWDHPGFKRPIPAQRYVNLAVRAYEAEEITEGELTEILHTDRQRARQMVAESRARRR